MPTPLLIENFPTPGKYFLIDETAQLIQFLQKLETSEKKIEFIQRREVQAFISAATPQECGNLLRLLPGEQWSTLLNIKGNNYYTSLPEAEKAMFLHALATPDKPENGYMTDFDTILSTLKVTTLSSELVVAWSTLAGKLYNNFILSFFELSLGNYDIDSEKKSELFLSLFSAHAKEYPNEDWNRDYIMICHKDIIRSMSVEQFSTFLTILSTGKDEADALKKGYAKCPIAFEYWKESNDKITADELGRLLALEPNIPKKAMRLQVLGEHFIASTEKWKKCLSEMHASNTEENPNFVLARLHLITLDSLPALGSSVNSRVEKILAHIDENNVTESTSFLANDIKAVCWIVKFTYQSSHPPREDFVNALLSNPNLPSNFLFYLLENYLTWENRKLFISCVLGSRDITKNLLRDLNTLGELVKCQIGILQAIINNAYVQERLKELFSDPQNTTSKIIKTLKLDKPNLDPEKFILLINCVLENLPTNDAQEIFVSGIADTIIIKDIKRLAECATGVMDSYRNLLLRLPESFWQMFVPNLSAVGNVLDSLIGTLSRNIYYELHSYRTAPIYLDIVQQYFIQKSDSDLISSELQQDLSQTLARLTQKNPLGERIYCSILFTGYCLVVAKKLSDTQWTNFANAIKSKKHPLYSYLSDFNNYACQANLRQFNFTLPRHSSMSMTENWLILNRLTQIVDLHGVHSMSLYRHHYSVKHMLELPENDVFSRYFISPKTSVSNTDFVRYFTDKVINYGSASLGRGIYVAALKILLAIDEARKEVNETHYFSPDRRKELMNILTSELHKMGTNRAEQFLKEITAKINSFDNAYHTIIRIDYSKAPENEMSSQSIPGIKSSTGEGEEIELQLIKSGLGFTYRSNHSPTVFANLTELSNNNENEETMKYPSRALSFRYSDEEEEK